jgi:iron complex transport system substrate-binding protein
MALRLANRVSVYPADQGRPPPRRRCRCLPAVRAGRAFPIRYTEAATYSVAMKTLDPIDQALAPLLTP